MKWSFSPKWQIDQKWLEKINNLAWTFGRRKKKTTLEGLVGIVETQTGIAITYGVASGSQMIIKAQSYQAAEDLAAKQDALIKFVNNHQLQGVPCSYVLANDNYSLNLIEAPAVAKEEMNQALRWVLKDIVNFPMEEAVVNTFPLPYVRARDSLKMIYAVVMRKNIIPQIENLIVPSGLVLTIVDIPELILKNILNRYPKEVKSCACVQITEKIGKLILCRDKQLCITRTFELKLDEFGKAPEQDAKILESLALEIQRSFDYMNSVFRQSISNVIVLAPTLLNGHLIAEYLKNTLGAEINLLKLSECLTFETPLKEEEEPNYLFAVGALLREEENLE